MKIITVYGGYQDLKVQLENIESSLFDLVGQIDAGDISNIDTFWTSLSDTLLELNIPGWHYAPLPTKAKLKSKSKSGSKSKSKSKSKYTVAKALAKMMAMIKAKAKVSDVLTSIAAFKPDLVDNTLIETASEMEELSFPGSENSIDYDDLETLQSLASDFETLFTEFLEKVKESYGE